MKLSFESFPRFMAFILVASLVGLTACASTPGNEMQQEPKMHEPTPLASGISVTRTLALPHPVEEVFDFITAEDVLPKILTGYGPLPAVTGTSGNTGPWDTPGSQREVHLADGTRAREQVLTFVPRKAFSYRVWDFGNPIIRSLANEARGEWSFEESRDGTKVTWTYTFYPKNALARAPLFAITRLFWRGYMNVTLENTEAILLRLSRDNESPRP